MSAAVAACPRSCSSSAPASERVHFLTAGCLAVGDLLAGGLACAGAREGSCGRRARDSCSGRRLLIICGDPIGSEALSHSAPGRRAGLARRGRDACSLVGAAASTCMYLRTRQPQREPSIAGTAHRPFALDGEALPYRRIAECEESADSGSGRQRALDGAESSSRLAQRVADGRAASRRWNSRLRPRRLVRSDRCRWNCEQLGARKGCGPARHPADQLIAHLDFVRRLGADGLPQTNPDSPRTEHERRRLDERSGPVPDDEH